MPILETPQFSPRPTQHFRPANPGLVPTIGDIRNHRDRSASKKVDDISRHESKHDMAPKHEPKPNAREKTQEWTKPGGSKPQAEKPGGGTGKK
jgi:hypothetical protein